DFSNLVHGLIFEAVPRLSLHHTVHVRCLARALTRDYSLFRGLDGLAFVCRLLRCWRLAVNLSHELSSRFGKGKILRFHLTVSMSDTDRKQREECPGCEWRQQHREDYFHGDNQYYFSTWMTAFKQDCWV